LQGGSESAFLKMRYLGTIYEQSDSSVFELASAVRHFLWKPPI